MKLFLYSCIFLLSTTLLVGQDHHFGVLLKEELSGVEIYDVLVSTEELIYLATNQGLYQYSNDQLQYIPSIEAQQGNAIFELKEASNGAIIFHNLHGQWFAYHQGRTTLVFSLTKEKDIALAQSNLLGNTLLIVSSSAILKYNLDKQSLSKFPLNTHAQNFSFFTYAPNPDSIIVFPPNGQDSLYLVTETTITPRALTKGMINSLSPTADYYFVGDSDNLILLNNEGGAYSLQSQQHFPIEKGVMIRGIKGEYWMRGLLKGLSLYKIRDTKLEQQKTFLAEQFISCVEPLKDGSVLLGTFGNGLIHIKDKRIQKMNLPATTKQLVSFEKYKDHFFLLSADGKVIQATQEKHKLLDQLELHTQKLFYYAGQNFHLNPSVPALLYTRNLSLGEKYFGYGAIKDAVCTEEGEVFIASSGLVLKSDRPEQDTSIWRQSASQLGIYYFQVAHLANKRLSTVGYLEKHQEIIVSDLASTYSIHQSTGEVKELKYEHAPVGAKSIATNGQSVFIGTKRHGILSYDGEQLGLLFPEQEKHSKRYAPKNIQQLAYQDSCLLIRTSEDIQLVNLQKKTQTVLGKAEGIDVRAITDFQLSQDTLFFLAHGELLFLRLEDPVLPRYNLSVYWDSLVVADKIREQQKDSIFAADENNLKLCFSIRSLKLADEANVVYQLEGVNREWIPLQKKSDCILYQSLASGQYTFRLKALLKGKVCGQLSYRFTIQKPWYLALENIIAIAFGILALLALIWYLILKAINKKHLKKIEQERLISLVHQTRLKAIRSQMNPHFIFNALNSIQHLILQQKTIEAYDYLVEFSELVRKILNFSNQDFVSIEEELNFIELYLTLEKLRFSEDFTYQIENTIAEQFQIPSLMIQPFIENAIQHGLLHKVGKKKLSVRFFKNEEFCCEIIDNGIGRKKAEAIKEKSQPSKASFSLKATQTRLEIFNQQYDRNIRFEIEDCVDQNGVCGTRVIIYLPIIQKNHVEPNPSN